MDGKIKQLLIELALGYDFDMVVSGRQAGSNAGSDASDGREPISKVKVRPVKKKEDVFYQIEEYRGKQVFHQNVDADGMIAKAEEYLSGDFKQAEIQAGMERIHVLFSKKGR